MSKRKAFITGITGQDGSYLAEILLDRKNLPFSPTEVLAWADTLLEILKYLHEGDKANVRKDPIIHGDIKPAPKVPANPGPKTK